MPADYALPELEPIRPTPLGQIVAPIDAARAEAAAIREAARAEGYADGMAAAQAEVGTALAALAEAVDGVDALRADVADEAERAAVELALTIAGHALQGALDAEPERVLDVVRGALRRLVDRERVTILVNPEDFELVRSCSTDLAAELGGVHACDVQAERRVGRGGAVVRTPEGEVDATLESKLALAREAVAGALAG